MLACHGQRDINVQRFQPSPRCHFPSFLLSLAATHRIDPHCPLCLLSLYPSPSLHQFLANAAHHLVFDTADAAKPASPTPLLGRAMHLVPDTPESPLDPLLGPSPLCQMSLPAEVLIGNGFVRPTISLLTIFVYSSFSSPCSNQPTVIERCRLVIELTPAVPLHLENSHSLLPHLDRSPLSLTTPRSLSLTEDSGPILQAVCLCFSSTSRRFGVDVATRGEPYQKSLGGYGGWRWRTRSSPPSILP
jgi:hypothetical protein